MVPQQLSTGSFQAYPPEARALAGQQLGILRRLPLGLAPLLLRELIGFDWKFPAEKRDLNRQFAYLAGLSPAAFDSVVAPFAQLRLSPALEGADWVNSPAAFSEQLTAHLWATGQIAAFRKAAVDYVDRVNRSAPDEPLPTHRLGIVVIGQGVERADYSLFRKLRPQGVHFTQVSHQNGLTTLLDAVRKRAAAHPEPYGHWYVDGGAALASSDQNLKCLSYGGLAPVRAILQRRMRESYEAGQFDPEAFRTNLAKTRPDDLGLDAGADPILQRFGLSLLTEGSGTQVFATTFVQWAAREVLRRAQPLTFFARFAPRQQERPMGELLAETQQRIEVDPRGSLIDADMGAYYTWVNQQRLPGADQARFLVWFENHDEAVLIRPGLERGKRDASPVSLQQLIEQAA